MKQMLLRKRVFRMAAMLICLAVLLSAGAVTALAYERIDTGKEASLTVYFAEDGTGMEGAVFHLYRVADVSDAVEFALTGSFAGAPVSIDAVESSGGWADMAATLSAYADAGGISPEVTGTADENGSTVFSGLKVGLYLLTGDTVVAGDYSYTPAPAVIMLPSLMDNDTWEYNPSVDVKCTKKLLARYQDVTVKKVWDDGSRSERPGSVKIQLLQDGGVYETVTLDADNNWTYTWNNLTSAYESIDGEKEVYEWTVNEEDVPAGYTVTVSQNNSTFTVTNTYRTAADTHSDTKLPQTGSLNWPIPVLTILGLLLLAAGWYLFSRREKN